MDISKLNSTADNLASILSSQKAQREQVAQYALARGLSLMQEKKYDRAVSEFKRAAAFNPEMIEAYEYLGKTYQITGKSKEAIEAFKSGVAYNPTSEKAITSLGNAYIEAKQYDEAEKQFKRLAMVAPTSAYPYNSLGHIYQVTSRFTDAEAQFKKVIKLSPRDANGYYGLGLALSKQKKYAEAIEQFEEAIALKKDFAYAFSDLGYAYIESGVREKAEGIVQILEDLDSNLALELRLALYTPKISSVKPLDSTFPSVLGPRTPVSVLDASLITPNQTKTFSLTFQFNQAMDASSVQNSLNWFIYKASGGTSGWYNNGITIQPEKEILLSPIPSQVTYDPTKYTATIFFPITQNATGDGVIDPSHWVFKFNGNDISGHIMDPGGDEYDGFALSTF
jgi:tetratricopeptide (TPR) repeat protein